MDEWCCDGGGIPAYGMKPLGTGIGGGKSFGVAAAGGLTRPWPEPDRLLAVPGVVAGGDDDDDGDEFHPAPPEPLGANIMLLAC